ncbi:hypothetical protein V1264_012895 [Littorina saxatilis]|uniref:C-type lectin domain-containing protein n=1 Tax=Littorina saxatilis TaxID=31220 RepID=A0AAN9GP27_9CAEN
MLPRIILLAAGMLLLTQLAESYSSRCRTGWSSYRHNCYLVIKDRQSWTGAQVVCEMLNANLATITSSSENSAVARMVKSAGAYDAWVGLNDFAKEGSFHGIKSSSRASYTCWKSGQPNNFGGNQNCAALYSNMFWHDDNCSLSKMFVCEY